MRFRRSLKKTSRRINLSLAYSANALVVQPLDLVVDDFLVDMCDLSLHSQAQPNKVASPLNERRMYRVFCCIALSTIVLSACSPPPRGKVPTGTVTDWPGYGGTPGGSHFSRANQITPENVQYLELAWEHRSGDIRAANISPDQFISGHWAGGSPPGDHVLAFALPDSDN